MLRGALTGADERADELVEVAYTLGALADALTRQVGLGKIVQISHYTHEHFFSGFDVLQILAHLVACMLISWARVRTCHRHHPG